MNALTEALQISKLIKVIPRSRNLEALLLFFAAGLNAFELAQIQLSIIEKMTLDLFTYWIPPVLFAFVLHMILRRRASEADPLILPIAVALNGLGIAMIYRLDLATIASGGAELFAFRQVMWTALAMAFAAIVILYIPSQLFLRRYVYTAMAAGILLLLLPLVPVIGTTINGATLWISLFGVTFQPGEIAKIALIVFFAGYLVNRKDSLAVVGKKIFGIRIPRGRELGPILLIWLASIGVLVLQRDLGTSILYFGLFLVMIYVATGRAFYAGIGVAMLITGGLVASRVLDYVSRRFDAWLNPFDRDNYDAVGGSYQIVQGIFGMANGGLFGSGLGGGVPQLVPLAESDFIIASLAEELGLIGFFAILALYFLLVSRGLKVAFRHSDEFAKLMAVGFSFVIALQLFVVIGGVTRILPLTGLTTPFLAAGGSSLLANWIIIAMLLRLSDSAADRQTEVLPR
ncbi:MAG: FtsW/RodA/SpoVE family cell cycle protein [Rhodoluna sp.]